MLELRILSRRLEYEPSVSTRMERRALDIADDINLDAVGDWKPYVCGQYRKSIQAC
jgi:hypothetical protein